MSGERIHRDLGWTPEDRARHKAIREKFQRERPTLQQLVESGDAPPPIPLGLYVELRLIVIELKKVREAAGLSLADVARRMRSDELAVRRLEDDVYDNPTVEAVLRYATAVGKRVTFTVQDAPVPATAH